MQTYVEGYYLDGKSPVRHRARVHLTPTGLRIQIEEEVTLWWPHEEIHQSLQSHPKGQVGLERGAHVPEVLIIPGPAFLQGLKGMAPDVAKRFQDPTRGRNWVLITFLSILGIAVVCSLLYLWGIPTMASLVASHVPVSWEERLGQAIVQYLAPSEKKCQDPTGTEMMDKMVHRLAPSHFKAQYTFRVVLVNDTVINAAAAPGGYIIVFKGLIQKTKTAEEVAGILAHEMQHILHRHATRAILQHASTSLLVSAMVGDAKGAMTYGLEGARILGMLRYSRKNEEEADREAVRMLLASGIDPMGMVTFFERIKKEKELTLPAYLSTHPDLGNRIEWLKGLIQASPAPSGQTLPEEYWQTLQRICKN